MKEIVVRIPEEDSVLATQLLKRLGAEIEEIKTEAVKSKLEKKTVTKKKKVSEKISPTYLFGKWKNLDIDAKKLREEAWDRSHKFL
jgi:cysteine synthase